MHDYVQNENIKEIKISNNFTELLKQNKQSLVSLSLAENTCFAIYRDETQEVLINCLTIDDNGAIEIYTKEVIQKTGVKQILQLNIDKIALLLSETIEIWSVKDDMILIQNISVMNSQQIVKDTHNNVLYLAAIEPHTTNTSREGTINIFKSFNGSNFVDLQSLNCVEPQQILFSNNKESNDFILYVLRNATNPTLIAYQHKVDVGFKTVLGVYTLNPAKQLQNIQFTLDPKYLIALYGKDDITIIEAKFGIL
ncbi:uncharacterized protein LOC119674334 [Teleopsis dalmanni]|uniref:uncharacterized protein LOC119674334 n=1 Tax=Teleopsis dalmanni TaxID=139649 RepID=UPI0018CDF427|nr:uncharacterized protein LOC119674334 [Teleopsis dalmanni]